MESKAYKIGQCIGVLVTLMLKLGLIALGNLVALLIAHKYLNWF